MGAIEIGKNTDYDAIDHELEDHHSGDILEDKSWYVLGTLHVYSSNIPMMIRYDSTRVNNDHFDDGISKILRSIPANKLKVFCVLQNPSKSEPETFLKI